MTSNALDLGTHVATLDVLEILLIDIYPLDALAQTRVDGTGRHGYARVHHLGVLVFEQVAQVG